MLATAANEIGDEGAAALASALESGKTKLKQVYLWGNKIGDKGKQALAPHSKIVDWSQAPSPEPEPKPKPKPKAHLNFANLG